jgi:hypothetical protein
MLPNKLDILVVGKLIQEQFKILVLSMLAQAVDVRCIVWISSGETSCTNLCFPLFSSLIPGKCWDRTSHYTTTCLLIIHWCPTIQCHKFWAMIASLNTPQIIRHLRVASEHTTAWRHHRIHVWVPSEVTDSKLSTKILLQLIITTHLSVN